MLKYKDGTKDAAWPGKVEVAGVQDRIE